MTRRDVIKSRDWLLNPREETQIYFLLLTDCFDSWSSDSQRLASLWAAFPWLKKNKKKVKTSDSRSYSPRTHFLQTAFFFFLLRLKNDVIAGIQKSFLVWTICNPFVVKSTPLATPLKVFMLPVESSRFQIRALLPHHTLLASTQHVLLWKRWHKGRSQGHTCWCTDQSVLYCCGFQPLCSCALLTGRVIM